MRNFSDWEKDIIREIANLGKDKFTFDVFLLFKDVFIDRAIFYYEVGPRHLFYDFTKVMQGDLYKEERLLIDRATFINSLADNKYVHISSDIMTYKSGVYGKKTDSQRSIVFPGWFMDYFHNCVTAKMYVSQDLYSLVENDFKEYDELVLEEAKMQTKSAKLSVWFSAVAVIIAFASLMVGIFCSFAG